jgi:hypothetical protein
MRLPLDRREERRESEARLKRARCRDCLLLGLVRRRSFDQVLGAGNGRPVQLSVEDDEVHGGHAFAEARVRFALSLNTPPSPAFTTSPFGFFASLYRTL